MPATIQDIIRARIDRLEEPVKRTVQTAAVIGREFGLRLLTRISEMARGGPALSGYPQASRADPRDALLPGAGVHLQARRHPGRGLPESPGPPAKELHGAIGRAIEELYADRLEEQADILAYHYARSAHQDKAVTYALLAGDHAVRLYARAEATTHYAQALSLARELPESPEAQRLQIDATLKLAAVGASREDMERDQAHLAEAHALAEALVDEPRLAQILYWQGRLAYVRGDMQTAIPHAEQSLALADRLADETLSAPPVNLLGRIYTMQWECARGSQLLARSTAQMHDLGNRAEEATAAGFAGLAFGFLGVFASALPYADRGVEIARDLHDPFAEAAALHYRSMVYDQQGAWEQALTDWDTARRVAEGVGDRFRGLHGAPLVRLGRHQGGEPDRWTGFAGAGIGLCRRDGDDFSSRPREGLPRSGPAGVGRTGHRTRAVPGGPAWGRSIGPSGGLPDACRGGVAGDCGAALAGRAGDGRRHTALQGAGIPPGAGP